MVYELVIKEDGETKLEMDFNTKDEAINEAATQYGITHIHNSWELEEDGNNITLSSGNIIITIIEKE